MRRRRWYRRAYGPGPRMRGWRWYWGFRQPMWWGLRFWFRSRVWFEVTRRRLEAQLRKIRIALKRA